MTIALLIPTENSWGRLRHAIEKIVHLPTRTLIVFHVLFLLLIPNAAALNFPERPIRIVVGFVPGGGADATARLVAHKLYETWGQPVIVDNRAGAGGNVAAEIVAKAGPDGYTLLLTSPGPVVINPSLFRHLPYNPRQDLAAVTLVASGPNVLVVRTALPATDVRELIALARAKPGGLTFASSGAGSIPHLSAELFKIAAKVELVHVAYKGAGPAVIDLIAGRVDLMFVSAQSALTQIRAQRLKALAVTSLKRSATLPELPTLDEAGLPGYESIAWWGLLAPARAPRDILLKLNAAVVKSLNQPDTKEKLASEGAEIVANSPAQFDDFLRKEAAKWASVIDAAKLKLE